MKNPLACTAEFTFLEGTTLSAARAFAAQKKRMAVLNFANPVEPGGGVLRGASAQEEYLCRASNLYPCLTGKAAREWYQYHREAWKRSFDGQSFLASDRVVYSPDIVVLRKDEGYQPVISNAFEQVYTDSWNKVDVITSAAPCFLKQESVLPEKDLEDIFKRRIRNILEAAIENDIQILVLGAFGCGAFHNPPMVVARAFYQVLLDLVSQRYRYAFEEIVFAVMRTGSYCKNIQAFETYFLNFPDMTLLTPEYIRAHECID